MLDLIGQNAAKGWDVCLKEPGESKRSTDEEPIDPLKEEDFVSEPSQEKKSLLSGLFTKPKKKERKAEQAWFIVDEEEEADGPVRQETPLYEETTTFLNPDEECCKGILRYAGTGEEPIT